MELLLIPKAAFLVFIAACISVVSSGCGSTVPKTAFAGLPPTGPSNTSAPVQRVPQLSSTPAPGTTWSYNYSVNPSGPWALPTSGTLSVTYVGQAAYRGHTYFQAVDIGDISGNDVDAYYTWNGTFEEYAATNKFVPPMPCETPPRSETVLSQPVSFNTPSSETGTATFYVCQTPSAPWLWSLSITQSGQQNVTVPAGTFATTQLSGVWKLNSVERDYTVYMYGNAMIKRVTTEYDNGSPAGTFTLQLASGPTNVAIPGPATLGADYW